MKQPISKSSRLIVGHSGRMDVVSRRLSFVLLGQFFVFLMAMFHDEFTEYLVLSGNVMPENSGVVETVIGVVLFIAWIIMTARLATLLNSVKPKKSDGDEAQ